MPRRAAILPVLAVAILLVSQIARTQSAQTLVPAGALWKYNDSGVDLGTAWRSAAYNDSGWASGFAELGYGDGDESTVLSYGGNATNRHITYYFRHTFTVSSLASIGQLTARLLRDDGAIVYLNGVEVIRSNMPTGTVGYSTPASSAVGTDETTWFSYPIAPSQLITGANVLAVELHQSSATSSDISLNFELLASSGTPPPVVTLVSPANHIVSNQSAVTFTAQATGAAGLSSATLAVSTPPQTVSFAGPGQIEDAQITADSPNAANGSSLIISANPQGPHAHALLKIPALIGSGAGQVPAGATITSATLQVNCTSSGGTAAIYRLTEDWVEDEATWNQRKTGTPWGSPGAHGAGSNAGAGVGGGCSYTGWRTINVTRLVQDWSNGSPNHGLVLTDAGSEAMNFNSSESANSPTLSVTFKTALMPVVSQPLSGTSATINFNATVSQPGTWFWNVKVTDADGATSWASTDFEYTMNPAAPNAPVALSPANGATGVSPTAPLQALVSAAGGGTLTVTAEVRKKAAPEFTLLVMPDTLNYSEFNPSVYMSQTQWIKNNVAARNIVFVTHEGDVVNHATSLTEYQAADAAMRVLDGVVPYAFAPGNHDLPTTIYNSIFPFTRYAGLPWYGGHYQSSNDDSYQLFTAGGMDFVIVHMEFCPPAGAVSWASSILNAYPNRIGIVTTHGYLNESAQRTVSGCGSTQYLWDGLAVPNPNLHFMLSGHIHDEARRSDVANGHPVHQILADYQDRPPTGGEGWLRTMRFVPGEDSVYVQTYSPWLNLYESDAN